MGEVQIVNNMVDITIDGVGYKAKEGEFILNAARANDVFIPAICYLTRCSPTLACRICLVEADGKQVYSCNAKVKEGMEVTTSTPTILEERRAIMEVYDVNHPLQCGVCDKSGECELQNYTLELQVDSQSYTIADTKRETIDWNDHIHYDPALCIVCERCTTVCKDIVGDAAITTIKRGGIDLDKAYKETMPKDAYSMWNKLQKSLIGPSDGTDSLDCESCGECIAVCPVGALASVDFVYSSNAWDLKKIPAVSAHSSDGFQIYYEVKPTSIENREEKIFRVTNEWNYVSLDGSARFAYDFENKDVIKDKVAFNAAIEALKKAKTIRFNSVITNEEALMLQTLKEKMGIKLYNPEVRAFQKFLNTYQEASGSSLYSTDTDAIMKNTDFVVCVGTALNNDSPGFKHAFNNAQKMNKAAGLYFHTISDAGIAAMGKTVECFTHKVGLEEASLYLVLDLFADKEKLPEEVKDYIESFKSTRTETTTETVEKTVKEMVLNEETGEEEEVSTKVKEKVEKEISVSTNDLVNLLGGDSDAFEEVLVKMMKKKESFSLMVGEDFYFHPKAENLAKLVALIEMTCNMNVVMCPPKSNALGVALICDLDDVQEGYTVGYNENGDFKLSALGTGDLDMPALNQQEGTLTNLSRRVVPTNVAVGFGGYELNDLVRELVGAPELTIDWTKKLPKEKGYKEIDFDSLPNKYLNDGTEDRGYVLEIAHKDVNMPTVEKFDESLVIEGDIVYRCNPIRQFSDFSDKAHEIKEQFGLYVSLEKAKDLGEKVEIIFENGSISVDVFAHKKIEGDIMKLSDFKAAKGVYDLFAGSRYKTVTVRKV